MPEAIRGSYQYFTRSRASRTCAAPATMPASPRSRKPSTRYVDRLSRHGPTATAEFHACSISTDTDRPWRSDACLCIGDLMLDEFVYGDVTRISPEAPAPVIAVTRSEAMVGGAGNVARNIVASWRALHLRGRGRQRRRGAGLTSRTSMRSSALIEFASRGRSQPADHAQGALRLGALFDPSAARRLGKRALRWRRDIEDALIAACPSRAAARGRGGAVGLCQGRADAARHPRRDRRCARAPSKPVIVDPKAQ